MVFTAEFIQSVIVLLITALLSGFLIPYILKMVDDSKSQRQKITEAELQRQEKIIEAQSKLLDDITRLLWQWRYLSIKLTYYGGQNQGDNYAQARQQYDVTVWDILNALRTEISRARRLVSEAAYRQLLQLYTDIVQLDRDLCTLESLTGVEQRMAAVEFNQRIYGTLSAQIDDVLRDLAVATKLISH